MRSRRGRELVFPSKNKPQPNSDFLEHYYSKSAIHLLDEFIAAFTPDRVPLPLVEARDKIRTSNDIQELQGFQQSPYKIVRDAAEDKVRLLNKQPPQISSSGSDPRWGQITDGRIAPQIMAPMGHFESRHFSFDPHSHDLARTPGRLAGNVDESYLSFTHHLQARRLKDEAIVQAQSERPRYLDRSDFPIKE